MARPRLRRGNLVTVALAGDYGKPRPAVIVQSDRLAGVDSILVCPLTSDLATIGPARVQVEPSDTNGLRSACAIMADKVTATRRDRCRQLIGRLDEGDVARLDEALALVIGLAG
ncbi:MAG: type II toxin-antitoxin system PemK/MazF family toxin [Sphingosinicella sp.]